MWHSGRRVDVARSWALARQQYAGVVAERDALRRELAGIKAQRDEFRQCLHELRDASLARMKAEAELAALYRERTIQSAQRTERDPAARLQ